MEVAVVVDVFEDEEDAGLLEVARVVACLVLEVEAEVETELVLVVEVETELVFELVWLVEEEAATTEEATETAAPAVPV